MDVSSIGSMIKTKVTPLQIMFIIEKTNLNVLPNFGHDGGFLKWLLLEICGSKYHDVDMVHDCFSRDLEKALAFQKYFTKAIIEVLEVTFVDNNLMDFFNILSLANMRAKQVGLESWGVTNLQSIVKHYGVDCAIRSKPFLAMVDVATIKRKFLTFKIQATTEW